jgi:hypothetical protein
MYKDLELTVDKLIRKLKGTYTNKESLIDKIPGDNVHSILDVLFNVNFVQKDNKVIVLNIKSSYVIYDYYYCSCNDFFLRNLIKKENRPCKHVLALIYHRLIHTH